MCGINTVLKAATARLLQVAVIVNDMAEVNIDAALVANPGDLRRAPERLVELSNGCICCTLRDDLLQARPPGLRHGPRGSTPLCPTELDGESTPRSLSIPCCPSVDSGAVPSWTHTIFEPRRSSSQTILGPACARPLVSHSLSWSNTPEQGSRP